MAIEALMDLMEKAHHTRFRVSPDTPLAPFIMLINEKNELHSYTEVPMGDDRDETVLAILTAVISTKSFGYIFSSEAWLSVVDKKDLADMPMPRDDPEKQEVLIMEGNSLTETSMRLYDIVRDEAGNVSELKRKEDYKGMRMHSRFDIFPRPKHDVEDLFKS